MAEITPTNRKLSGHGALRKETGTFAAGAGGDTLKTKLSKILFFSLAGETTDDNSGLVYINSSSAATTQLNGGWIYTVALANGETYSYAAYGY